MTEASAMNQNRWGLSGTGLAISLILTALSCAGAIYFHFLSLGLRRANDGMGFLATNTLGRYMILLCIIFAITTIGLILYHRFRGIELIADRSRFSKVGFVVNAALAAISAAMAIYFRFIAVEMKEANSGLGLLLASMNARFLTAACIAFIILSIGFEAYRRLRPLR